MSECKSSERNCVKFRLYGVVQGVGFRPFVAKLANEHGIVGTVKNSGGCVQILACGNPDRLSAFERALFAHKPMHARIVHIEKEEASLQEFDGFSILPSETTPGRVFLPSDPFRFASRA